MGMDFSSSSADGSRRQDSIFRMFFLVLVFVAAGFLFWKNYERSMDVILFSHVVQDETDTLSREQKDELSSIAKGLQDRFGFGLQIRVLDNLVQTPEPDSRVIFMGISPACREVSIVWPPVLRRALPQGFTRHLEEEHFEEYWQGDNWPRGLYQALQRLGEELLAIEQE
ncbi:TPM domain-containing protein [Desulfonatronospira sp.]|uniref:TPM domain-containing protein n=1 Tax=Desulfonatronospira sp. TaxID=1962951 RepID=UPI0025C565AB|nr:TPM domain-containing protein [Desulfonatronospira sp.]